MGTEADKTNTAVIGTLFAIGAAAMIAGSAALVALARGEMEVANQELGGYADLRTVRDLKAKQRARLQQAKLPLAKAEGLVLKEIQANPSAASPATEVDPESTPAVEQDAGAGEAGNTDDAEQPDDGEKGSTNDQGSTESADEAAERQPAPKSNPGAPPKAPEPAPTVETPPKSGGSGAPAPQPKAPKAPVPTSAPKSTAPKAPPTPAPVPGQ